MPRDSWNEGPFTWGSISSMDSLPLGRVWRQCEVKTTWYAKWYTELVQIILKIWNTADDLTDNLQKGEKDFLDMYISKNKLHP